MEGYVKLHVSLELSGERPDVCLHKAICQSSKPYYFSSNFKLVSYGFCLVLPAFAWIYFSFSLTLSLSFFSFKFSFYICTHEYFLKYSSIFNTL